MAQTVSPVGLRFCPFPSDTSLPDHRPSAPSPAGGRLFISADMPASTPGPIAYNPRRHTAGEHLPRASQGAWKTQTAMPHSPITLGVLTDAVMYLARADGYLSQRLLYVDQRWLAPLSEDELDDDLRADLAMIRRAIRETHNTFTLHWAAETLVTMLMRYAGRLQADSRR
jgi:hypothetical protein